MEHSHEREIVEAPEDLADTIESRNRLTSRIRPCEGVRCQNRVVVPNRLCPQCDKQDRSKTRQCLGIRQNGKYCTKRIKPPNRICPECKQRNSHQSGILRSSGYGDESE
jgi:hypothetical protein